MVLSMDRWVGKVAIVIGAGAGIGRAITVQLVKAEMQVVAIARSKTLLDQDVKKLQNLKGRLLPFETDMTDEKDILHAFAFAKTIGPIHVLVNNAGGVFTSPLTNGDSETWRKTFDLNVIALGIATREAVKDMRKNGVQGHIVYVNRVMGQKAINFPGSGVYGWGKFAVTALTETLRQELNASNDNKIKVTSVSPGTTFAEAHARIRRSGPPARRQRLMSTPALQAEDVAQAVEYVLGTPPHVQVHDLTIKPVGEKF